MGNRFGRGLASLLRHPIRSASTLVTGIAFVYAFVSVIYLVLTPNVFVEDAEIDQQLDNHGFTPAILVSAARDQMRQVAAARIDSLRAMHRRYLEIIELRSRTHRSSYVCDGNLPLDQANNDFFLIGLDRALLSALAPDSAVVISKDFSLRRLAFSVRRLLGWEPRRLNPILYREAGHYVIKVVPSPSVVPAESRSFDNLQDADKMLSDLLVNFLSPGLRAAEAAARGESDPTPYHVAADYLNDDQQFLLIQGISENLLLEQSLKRSDIEDRYKLFMPLNVRLLQTTNFDLYGDMGAILQLATSLRIARGARALGRYVDGEPPNNEQLYDTYVKPYSKRLERTVIGKVALTLIDLSFGRLQEFNENLREVLRHYLILDTNGAFSNSEFLATAIGVAIDSGQFERASQLSQLAPPDAEKMDPTFSKGLLAFEAMRSVIQAIDGDVRSYNQAFEKAKKYPCIRYMASSYLAKVMTKNMGAQPALRKAVLSNLPSFQAAGLASFEFFNSWGGLESDDGNYEAAMERYAEAMNYEGDEAWALLNWGNAAYRKGDLALARTKFQNSLEQELVPRAVYGLLDTFVAQRDGRSFLDAFEKYVLVLKDADEQRRNFYQWSALFFSCELHEAAPKNILKPGEGITVEGAVYHLNQFDMKECRFSHRPGAHGG